MTAKQKKLLLYAGLAFASMIICLIAWRLLTITGVIGAPVRMYARSTMPFGSVLVLLIPIIATGTLFYGLAHAKK